MGQEIIDSLCEQNHLDGARSMQYLVTLPSTTVCVDMGHTEWELNSDSLISTAQDSQTSPAYWQFWPPQFW